MCVNVISTPCSQTLIDKVPKQNTKKESK